MSYTVGLDFGTHQTKLCIEDASNPVQKRYEFVEHQNRHGITTVLLPSIVQINQDDTVSYGFVDPDRCKTEIPKPVKEVLMQPNLSKTPPKPSPPLYQDTTDRIIQLEQEIAKTNEKHLKRELNKNRNLLDRHNKKMQKDYTKSLTQWKKIKIENQRNITAYEQKLKAIEIKYEAELKQWRLNPQSQKIYRYFKLASFTNSYKWQHDLSADVISVWYLTFILLTLQEKLGTEFYVQMGIPSGINKTILEIQERKAYSILIGAYKLVDRYKTKDNFLSQNYLSILEATELNPLFSDNDLLIYGLNVMPEAFAGLSSITHQKRIETGMNLLVDIGGGTTDVAFFTIQDDLPDIHYVLSFSKGLNFIFENYIKQYKDITLADVQDLFQEKKGDHAVFETFIKDYHHQLQEQVKKMLEEIIKSFECSKDKHQIPIAKLIEALDNRPLVFCGGGAIYKSMQIPLETFAEIKLINKNLLNIQSLRNPHIQDKLFPILATSYGLAIPMEDEMVITPIEKVFAHIEAPEHMRDSYKYDHGLSDI
ncbi:hypothetical protein [Mangrovimonas sp. YM274]|uniref:hypothetical protein n=1 Tax=Mangrovimonas sp. YM274 TaxID=3070660 RepID=UPI0027DAE7CC|nr:hypothetical protein [Mangrovimonas sp. YM274]WMI70081.1 hypothetical protein RBH95_06955 [Mangrovimonas sp. YM274]